MANSALGTARNSDFDMFLAAYGPEGNLQWVRTLSEYPYSLKELSQPHVDRTFGLSPSLGTS